MEDSSLQSGAEFSKTMMKKIIWRLNQLQILESMDKLTKLQIKAILNDQKFDGVVKFYNEFIRKIKDENVIGDSEFDTLKKVFIKEGKLIGLKEFFDQLESNVD